MKIMIRVRQVKVSLENRYNLKKYISKKMNVNENNIIDFKLVKESIDARKKPEIFLVYEVDVVLQNEQEYLKRNSNLDIFETPDETFVFEGTGEKILNDRPLIIGAGPAGLFCAYLLAEHGYKPIIIERGEKVEDRVKSVEDFWDSGNLNINSNVQFGEGGAGTFSDGKLNTLVKDKEFIGKKVFEIFVENGAPEEIMYLNKPHIGTDILRNVVVNMRNKIIDMGGTFLFNSCVTNILYKNEKIKGVVINNEQEIYSDVVVLAIGHSSRDTFKMLYDNKINMEAKPFAVGVRVIHPQKMINLNQYGMENHPYLKAASYKLTYTTKDKRGVYSFCMCPGGYVVNASSEEGKLCVNGMSNYKRDTNNANSAIVVTVSPKDFGVSPLDGINFQRDLEKRAYLLGNGKIPVQLFKNFMNNTISIEFGEVMPVTKGEYSLANLNNLFPSYITESLKEGILTFDNKIKGFAKDDAILLGVESRTSSPVKILRDEYGEANIAGLYPCGEGAGYAGGITTSAIDGIKVAKKIAQKYKTFKE